MAISVETRRVRKEWRERGRKEGREEGRKAGRKEGRKEGRGVKGRERGLEWEG